MRFDMTRPNICEICGESRYARNADHSACSKERQRRHEAARDTPLGLPGVPRITLRHKEAANRNTTNREIKMVQKGRDSTWRPPE